MSRIVRRFPLHCLAVIGLLALTHSGAHAAPLRSYTVTDLGRVPGAGLDNDGNVIDQPIRTIVGAPPTFYTVWGDTTAPWLSGRAISWYGVVDGTPDGRFLMNTRGYGNPTRFIMGTVVVDPNHQNYPGGLQRLELRHDYWTSIQGTDINASGEVIGRLARINDADRIDGDFGSGWGRNSFYAAAGSTTVHELIDLFPPSSGWRDVVASSINDNGQILGWGMNPEGEYSNFLLTPAAVPEPGTWAVFGLMAAAAGWRARRAAQRSVSTTK